MHPSPFDPDWKDYFRERREYMSGLFQEGEAPELGWLVEGLLPVGYLAVLAGRPKDGKTCFAAALAAAVSRGDEFAGMRTARNRVVYFAAEESRAEWDLALRPWLPETDPKWFRVAHARFAVDHAPDLFALTMMVQMESVRLVVVDPLLAATVHGDFKESRRSRSTLMGLKTMCAERNCSCIVVHHAKERAGRAHRVAENPQLAATASLNVVLNQRAVDGGRVVSLGMAGRGRFANRELELFSPEPRSYSAV